MDPRIEVEMARQYLVRNWQSVSNYSGWIYIKGEGEACPVGEHSFLRWQTIPDRILAAAPHLQGISGHERRLDELRAQGLSLLDALEIIDREFG